MKKTILLLIIIFSTNTTFGQSDWDLIKKGNICFSESNYNCSIKNYKKALKQMDPNHSQRIYVLSNLGTSYWRNKNHTAALKVIT